MVLLDAGDVIPGDGRLLEAKDLFVAEATLTGETFPVEKAAGHGAGGHPARPAHELPLPGHQRRQRHGRGCWSSARAGRPSSAGSPARSGSGRRRRGSSAGIRRFGYLLLEVTAAPGPGASSPSTSPSHRPVLESFLFSLAIAVGLTPQLLPAIISVNLAHGARRMARERVIVRGWPPSRTSAAWTCSARTRPAR